MKNGILTLSTFISAMLFPWPLTALLAVATAFAQPLVPFAAGIFADTLYYVPQAGAWPVFTLYGLGVSIIAVFVRSQLQASIMR